jgi:SagB-type dehydrogenase family enzyme
MRIGKKQVNFMGKIKKLPEPIRKGTISLEQAIAARRSRRDFLTKHLTDSQIGQLAWAAQGLDADTGHRTAPSAGATYPLELYLVNRDGLFHYVPAKHSLELLDYTELRPALARAALKQKFIEDAPMTIILAACFSRTTDYYGNRGVGFVYMEAGHAAQNIHLQAEALGLGSVVVGAFEEEAVKQVLSLPVSIEPLYLIPVGYYRE